MLLELFIYAISALVLAGTVLAIIANVIIKGRVLIFRFIDETKRCFPDGKHLFLFLVDIQHHMRPPYHT